MNTTVKIKDSLGNRDLLKLHKIAFLCSRKIPASVVLKCYDWAIEQREKGNCVISGFHSQIEKDVFHYLVKGTQPVILALPRGLKKRWEPEIKDLLQTDRFLIITPFDPSVKRITEESAVIRNQLMVNLADKVVVGYQNPNGNLDKLISSFKNKEELIYLV